MTTLAEAVDEPAKILLLGDSGAGKTGAKAALVAMGYKLRMIDTDKGFRILRALLTSDKYPYAAYMKKHGRDPNDLISYKAIDVPIDVQSVKVDNKPTNVLSPTSSAAWGQVISLMKEWKEGDKNFGPIHEWDNDTILDFDTLSTLALMAKFWVQDINNRLGSLEDQHGRDTGGAQELLGRMLMKLSSSSIRCNVIVTTHITRADVNSGAAQSPGALLREHRSVDPKGFPSAIGRALSPQIGKFFNDCFIVRRIESGSTLRQEISTAPVDNTSAKNSVWLEKTYPVSTGLAEIFAALRYQDPPHDLIEAVRGQQTTNQPNPNSSTGTTSQSQRGFGAKPT